VTRPVWGDDPKIVQWVPTWQNRLDGRYPNGLPAPTPGDWQLAEGHYLTAVIPLEIISPQEGLTTGTSARSYYYRCYPGIPWRVPIGVLGGSWPFKYEVLQGPTGLTIGEVYGSTDYGILSWANPTTGQHTITVLVTDQEGTQDSHTWLLTVTTNMAIFVDSKVATSGNGSFSSPFKTIQDFWGSSRNDATYAGYHVYFRAGTYVTHWTWDPEWTNTGSVPWRNHKPPVLLAYPGESVHFDVKEGCFWWADSGQNDAFLRGIRWTGVGYTGTYYNQAFHRFTGCSRMTVFENEFAELAVPGQTGTNPAHLFYGGGTTENNLISHNYFDDLDCGDWNDVELYNPNGMVIEHNFTRSSNAASGARAYYLKDRCRRISIRANTASLTQNSLALGTMDDWTSSSTTPHNAEYSWNNWRTTGDLSIRVGGTSAVFGSIWIRRNTLNGGYVQFASWVTGGPVTFENNVRQYGSTEYLGTFGGTVTGLDTDLSGSSGLVDANNELTATYEANRGTHGHEVV
jgi:hypothetical protein